MLTTLAARQHGFLQREQATRLGFSREAIRRMVSGGVLAEQSDGLLRLTAYEPDSDTPLWHATLRTGGTLSHRTAARRLGVELPPSPVEITVAYGYHPPRQAAFVVHRSRRLPPSHASREQGGLAFTTAPRTFVDLATPRVGIETEQLLACLDAWVGSGRISLSWLDWFLRHESRGLPGVRRARALVDSIAGERVESAAERELTRLLSSAGLGGFTTQFAIRRGHRTVARVDVAWPDRSVALELDGYRFHHAPGTFVQDRTRGNEITLAGWLLLRTTPAELRSDPAQLVSVVSAALEAGNPRPAETRARPQRAR